MKNLRFLTTIEEVSLYDISHGLVDEMINKGMPHPKKFKRYHTASIGQIKETIDWISQDLDNRATKKAQQKYMISKNLEIDMIKKTILYFTPNGSYLAARFEMASTDCSRVKMAEEKKLIELTFCGGSSFNSNTGRISFNNISVYYGDIKIDIKNTISTEIEETIKAMKLMNSRQEIPKGAKKDKWEKYNGREIGCVWSIKKEVSINDQLKETLVKGFWDYFQCIQGDYHEDQFWECEELRIVTKIVGRSQKELESYIKGNNRNQLIR